MSGVQNRYGAVLARGRSPFPGIAVLPANVCELGGHRWRTVMVNATPALFALESAAVQRTFVRPALNLERDRGTHVAGTLPSTASTA